MSRLCKKEDIPTVYKYNPNSIVPPSFDEFGTQFYQPYNAKKEYPEDFEHVRTDRSESEKDYPDPRGNQLWNKLKNEHKTDNKRKWDELYEERHEDDCPDSQEVDFIYNEIFPTLIPAVVDCLKAAAERRILRQVKFGMDAVDFIAEHVYNNNPEYPLRKNENKDLFDIERFQEIAAQNPRKTIPKSWEWKHHDAAVAIQKFVRGWLVRKIDSVQAMRKFWKALIAPMVQETTVSLLEGNTNSLVEVYPDITFGYDRRKGLSYEDVFKRKLTIWEEDKRKKEIEQRIKAYLSKSKSIIKLDEDSFFPNPKKANEK